MDLSYSSKVFVCCLLNHGIYTNIKTNFLSHYNDTYKLCIDQEESSDHSFQTYSFAVKCWIKLTCILLDGASHQSLLNASSLLDILDDYLCISPTHTIRLSILFETIWYIWKQNNGDNYKDKTRTFLAIILLTKALHLMEATHFASTRKKKCRASMQPPWSQGIPGPTSNCINSSSSNQAHHSPTYLKGSITINTLNIHKKDANVKIGVHNTSRGSPLSP